MLSDRLRSNVEAAPWVVYAVKQLEKELEAAYAELNKLRPSVSVVFDRDVWAKADKHRKFDRG